MKYHCSPRALVFLKNTGLLLDFLSQKEVKNCFFVVFFNPGLYQKAKTAIIL